MGPREFKDQVYEQLARVGSAFSSPKRLEILDVLAQGPRSVESIARITDMSVANTSRHLNIMRSSGLVVTQRDGLYIIYRLADHSVAAGFRALRDIAEARLAEVRELSRAFFDSVDDAEPVEVAEMLVRLRNDEVTVIDVRPRLEFEAGHLPGALSIPLDDLAARMSELPKGFPVVAYCRGPYCVLSVEAVKALRDAGYTAKRLSVGPLEWDGLGIEPEREVSLNATPSPMQFN